MFHKDYGIIFACDVSSLSDAESLARISVGVEEVIAYKIGFTLGLRYGLRQVTEALKSINPLPVIYDHQKAGTDIPQMGEPFAQCCKEGGIDGVIIFSQAGPETLDAFINGIVQYGMTPIIGSAMTHKGYLVSDGGYIIDDAPKLIFQTSLNKGVKHFVLPGNKPDVINKYAEFLAKESRASIMMPGIGSQGGDLETAFNACKGLKAQAIIGSAIYKAKDPRSSLRSFINSLNEYLNQKAKV